MKTNMKYIGSTLALFLVAGCGGGGGASAPDVDNTNYISFFDPTSTETSALRSTSVADGDAMQGTSDTIVRTSGRVVLGGLPGIIDANRETVTLDEGGTVFILRGATDYVARLVAEPAVSEPFIGVIGQPTATAGVPTTGQVTYGGVDNIVLEIIDGADLYDLTGSGSLTANFQNRRARMSITDLAGTRTTGLSTASVSDVVTIELTGAPISRGQISGGNAFLIDSTLANALSGSELVDLDAMFFGPAAAEVGGIVVIDDSAAGALRIQGVFTAE